VVKVEPEGELLMAEMLAPGRVASGEVFLYESLRWETDLGVDEALVARERYSLVPGTPSVAALRELFPTAYYGSVYVVLAQSSPMETCAGGIHDLHSESTWVGVSALRGGRAWVIKVVAENAIGLRATMGKVRRLIYAALGREEPNLRRTTPAG
jgi:urease accessory protein